MRNDLQIAEPLKVGFIGLFTWKNSLFQARDILNGILPSASHALGISATTRYSGIQCRVGHASDLPIAEPLL